MPHAATLALAIGVYLLVPNLVVWGWIEHFYPRPLPIPAIGLAVGVAAWSARGAPRAAA